MMLELLSTSGFGAVLGWVGGMANRYFDLKLKDKELAMLDKTQAHDLAKLDKEREFMLTEAAQKVHLLQLEGDQKTTQLGYDTLGKSYDNDKATYGGGMVDNIRGIIRPFATALYGAASLVMAGVVIYYAFFVYNIAFTAAQVYDLLLQVTKWIFFMAEMVVGWWFGSRPTPPRGNKVA